MDSILDWNRSDKEETDFYNLLGCHENSSTEQINAEYKIRARKEHPDKNLADHSISTERFKMLQQAKDVLTDPEKRKNYDRWRQSGVAISFDKWCSLNDSVRTTMHWVSKPKEPKNMLEGGSRESTQESSTSPDNRKRKRCEDDQEGYIVGNIIWQRQKGNDLLRKFRNYEI